MPDRDDTPIVERFPRKTGLRRWCADNPYVAVTGTVASVIALPLSLVLYVASIRSRELSVYVNPTRTILVRSGHSSDLHVVYKGQPISTDVTAIQVGLWNAGREPIRAEHVLQSIVIETVPKVSILEAGLRFSTRPVVSPTLDTSTLGQGTLGISWKILEHNDGFVIQLIVAGPAGETVRVGGVVEGQPSVQDANPDTRFSLWMLVPLGLILTSLVTIPILERLGRRLAPARLVTPRAIISWTVLGCLVILLFGVTQNASKAPLLRFDTTMPDDRPLPPIPPGPAN